MKHRINVSLALILSCVLGASSSLALASNANSRTAISRKTGTPRHERLRAAKPAQNPAPEGQSATLLPDGRLLLVGGIGPEGVLSTASLSDPLTGQTFPLANIRDARAGHSATVLPDGSVFIFGGTGANGRALKSAEIFDPATLSFQFVPSTGLAARAFHTATLLMDGRVLLVGGVGEKPAATVETWDFRTGQTSVLPARLNVPRDRFDACATRSMDDLAASTQDNSLLLSMAHEMAVPAAARGAILDVVTQHFNSTMSSRDAATRLAAAVRQAR